MPMGNISASQFRSTPVLRSQSSSFSMKPDTGGTFSHVGSKLGMSQTSSGGGGGFNIAGMANLGGGGLREFTR